MKRREFIKLGSLFSASLATGCSGYFKEDSKDYLRSPATSYARKNFKFTNGKRSAGGHKFFAVSQNPNDTFLKFPTLKKDLTIFKNPSIKLSLGNALEFRKCAIIDVYLKDKKIADIPLYTAFAYQALRCDIPISYAPEISQNGLKLAYRDIEIDGADLGETKNDKTEICFFDFSPNEQPELDALSPQILIYEDCKNIEKNFYESLYSLNSILPFGWMSGCQTEGLYELSKSGDKRAENSLKKHLNYFLDNQKGVVFENPRGYLFENGRFDSVEDFLPFATIDMVYPNHKATTMFLDWALPRLKKSLGKPKESRFLSTEGCYTFAYPMLRIAANRKNKELAQIALDETCIRLDRLVLPDGRICQRAYAGKAPQYPNWSRGVAWYMLGLVQILKIIDSHKLGDLRGVDKIRNTFKTSAKYLAQFQRNSYWDCFAGDATTFSESSGSMGISAAYALGAEADYLEKSYLDKANKALERFFTSENLEPDGLAKNITQSNRLGEIFQRSGKRIIMQLGSGLAAHIIAVNKRM